jgi:DNA gyrase subunit B
MYIGSKDLKGLHHCAKEIISNSIDEYLNGAGSEILVKLQKDGGIFIKDNGRGIPHGRHETGCSLLQACYGIANTGGKFDNATGQTGYNTSGGEHGTGGKAVNALSKRMIVSTAREGIKEIVEFSKGKLVSSAQEKSNETGVSVLFYPDETIFETVNFDSEKLQSMLQEFSFLCTGLKFIFIDEINGIEKTYYSDKGLYDYINYLAQDKNLICKPIYFTEKEGFFQVEVAMAYTSDYSNITRLYTNNIPQDKGTHLTGFKTALTLTFNNFLREKGWIKEKDANLIGSDIEEGQILIINFKMIDPVFKGQNKEELSSSEGRTYVQRLSTIALKDYFAANEKEVKKIADKALNARKAREAARKAKDAARGLTPRKRLLNLPTKLVDSWSSSREKCELLIAEGDSAGGGLVGARDGEFQAIFPIRGKLINLYKNSSDKVFANQEVVNIIKAIGLELDSKTKKLVYDKSKMRYGKIIMCCDAK